MKRLVVLLGLLAALLAPAAASAHPLGNFTVNRFSRIEVSGDRLYVKYVLDMAEIPTYQAGHIDAAAYATKIAANAHLTVNGQAVTLVPLNHVLAHPRGAGGLHTTRLEVILRGPVLHGPSSFAYHDENYSDRIGWKEIVVGTGPSRSNELRAYPKDMLQSPLDRTTAAAQIAPTGGPSMPPALSQGKALEAPDRVADSGFASLVGRHKLSLLVILTSMAAALFWGAAHALSPGHGKTIVTAYLVGQRGTPWHAALLGLIVTATHTIGVFGLGLVTLALSQFIVPDQLYPWLNLTSGLLVVAVGGWVLAQRFRDRRRARSHSHDHAHGHAHGHGHGHGHSHSHDHGHGHSHVPATKPGETGPSMRGLFAVGISGGLLPCPSALVVLLAAISLHRVAFGLALIVAFSLGLALSITGIGLVAVLAKRVFARVSFEGRVVSLLPAASALVILVAGVAMTVRAVPMIH